MNYFFVHIASKPIREVSFLCSPSYIWSVPSLSINHQEHNVWKHSLISWRWSKLINLKSSINFLCLPPKRTYNNFLDCAALFLVRASVGWVKLITSAALGCQRLWSPFDCCPRYTSHFSNYSNWVANVSLLTVAPNIPLIFKLQYSKSRKMHHFGIVKYYHY